MPELFTARLQAFAHTTASFIQPAVGATVQVSVDGSGWVPAGLPMFVEDAGAYTVVSVPDPLSIVLRNSGMFGGAAVSSTVPLGKLLCPGAG